MSATPASGGVLFRGEVMHHRVRPARNRFTYPVFFVRMRVADLDAAGPYSRLDRFGLIGFHRADHGPRDGSALLPWIRATLDAAGLQEVDGDIWLQAFPRVLGYVFNPVSFWLCHDRDGRLRAVVSEVNNTFGDHHNYLVARDDGAPLEAGDVIAARKVFHVSPFCTVVGAYRFQFDAGVEKSRIRIDYDDGDGKLLLTSISGRGEPLTRGALSRCFFAYPWMTLGVIARIHWQALKLWWKGVPFHSRPLPPARETTR